MEKRVTARQFQKAFCQLSDEAKREPVVITRHGKPSLVIIAAEEWERLKRRDRRVGHVVDILEEWVEEIAQAEVPPEFAHLDSEQK